MNNDSILGVSGDESSITSHTVYGDHGIVVVDNGNDTNGQKLHHIETGVDSTKDHNISDNRNNGVATDVGLSRNHDNQNDDHRLNTAPHHVDMSSGSAANCDGRAPVETSRRVGAIDSLDVEITSAQLSSEEIGQIILNNMIYVANVIFWDDDEYSNNEYDYGRDCNEGSDDEDENDGNHEHGNCKDGNDGNNGLGSNEEDDDENSEMTRLDSSALVERQVSKP